MTISGFNIRMSNRKSPAENPHVEKGTLLIGMSNHPMNDYGLIFFCAEKPKHSYEHGMLRWTGQLTLSVDHSPVVRRRNSPYNFTHDVVLDRSSFGKESNTMPFAMTMRREAEPLDKFLVAGDVAGAIRICSRAISLVMGGKTKGSIAGLHLKKLSYSPLSKEDIQHPEAIQHNMFYGGEMD